MDKDFVLRVLTSVLTRDTRAMRSTSVERPTPGADALEGSTSEALFQGRHSECLHDCSGLHAFHLDNLAKHLAIALV